MVILTKIEGLQLDHHGCHGRNSTSVTGDELLSIPVNCQRGSRHQGANLLLNMAIL